MLLRVHSQKGLSEFVVFAIHLPKMFAFSHSAHKNCWKIGISTATWDFSYNSPSCLPRLLVCPTTAQVWLWSRICYRIGLSEWWLDLKFGKKSRHNGFVDGLTWSADDTQIFTSSSDKTCKLWDVCPHIRPWKASGMCWFVTQWRRSMLVLW